MTPTESGYSLFQYFTKQRYYFGKLLGFLVGASQSEHCSQRIRIICTWIISTTIESLLGKINRFRYVTFSEVSASKVSHANQRCRMIRSLRFFTPPPCLLIHWQSNLESTSLLMAAGHIVQVGQCVRV